MANKMYVTLPVYFEKDLECFKASPNGIARLQEQMNHLIRYDNFFVIKRSLNKESAIEVGDVLGKVVEVKREGVNDIKLTIEAFNTIEHLLIGNCVRLQGYFREPCELVSYANYELTCVSLTKLKI